MDFTTPALISKLLRDLSAIMSASGKTTGRVSCKNKGRAFLGMLQRKALCFWRGGSVDPNQLYVKGKSAIICLTFWTDVKNLIIFIPHPIFHSVIWIPHLPGPQRKRVTLQGCSRLVQHHCSWLASQKRYFVGSAQPCRVTMYVLYAGLCDHAVLEQLCPYLWYHTVLRQTVLNKEGGVD